jgi:hypothetical protein
MPIVRNIKTDVTMSVPDHYVGHPILGGELEVVKDGEQSTKSPAKGNSNQGHNAPETDSISTQSETNK